MCAELVKEYAVAPKIGLGDEQCSLTPQRFGLVTLPYTCVLLRSFLRFAVAYSGIKLLLLLFVLVFVFAILVVVKGLQLLFLSISLTVLSTVGIRLVLRKYAKAKVTKVQTDSHSPLIHQASMSLWTILKSEWSAKKEKNT
jgi:hypothetical protein